MYHPVFDQLVTRYGDAHRGNCSRSYKFLSRRTYMRLGGKKDNLFPSGTFPGGKTDKLTVFLSKVTVLCLFFSLELCLSREFFRGRADGLCVSFSWRNLQYLPFVHSPLWNAKQIGLSSVARKEARKTDFDRSALTFWALCFSKIRRTTLKIKS